MVDSTSWEKIPLQDLQKRIADAREEGKYTMINDPSGKAATYFQVKERLLDFNKEYMKYGTKRQTKDATLEILRSELIKAMRHGQTFAINLGDIKFDFTDEWNDPEAFPSDIIMNFAEWHKDDVFMKFVMPEELTQHTFTIGKEFTICFISTSKNPDVFNMIADNIPHINDFYRFKIETEEY